MDEEKVFKEISEKQNKVAKTILTAVFCGIGALLIALAVVFWITGVRDSETDVSPAFILGPMGIFWVLIGLVICLVIPKNTNYQNYKNRRVRFGSSNTTDLFIEAEMQRARIDELEKRVEDLERRQDISESR